jgi:hypothetical protein
MDQNNPEDVVSVKYNGFEYRAFIGTATVEGITYTNAWFCWDTRREKCYIRCTNDKAKSCCTYIEDGKKRAYFGNNEGSVFKFATPVDEVYTDNGHEIDSFFITKSLDYGCPENVKIVNSMKTFTRHAAGMKVAVDIDKKNEFKEANTQIIKCNIDDLNFADNGRRYAYKFYQKGSGVSWQFEGFVILTKVIEEC